LAKQNQKKKYKERFGQKLKKKKEKKGKKINNIPYKEQEYLDDD
jgi:hypothetical protein